MEYCCPHSLHAFHCAMCRRHCVWIWKDILGMFTAQNIRSTGALSCICVVWYHAFLHIVPPFIFMAHCRLFESTNSFQNSSVWQTISTVPWGKTEPFKGRYTEVTRTHFLLLLNWHVDLSHAIECIVSGRVRMCARSQCHCCKLKLLWCIRVILHQGSWTNKTQMPFELLIEVFLNLWQDPLLCLLRAMFESSKRSSCLTWRSSLIWSDSTGDTINFCTPLLNPCFLGMVLSLHFKHQLDGNQDEVRLSSDPFSFAPLVS